MHINQIKFETVKPSLAERSGEYPAEVVTEFMTILVPGFSLPERLAATDMMPFIDATLELQEAIRTRYPDVAESDSAVIRQMLSGETKDEIACQKIGRPLTALSHSERAVARASIKGIPRRIARALHSYPGFTPAQLLVLVDNFVNGDIDSVPKILDDRTTVEIKVDVDPSADVAALLSWLRIGKPDKLSDDDLASLASFMVEDKPADVSEEAITAATVFVHKKIQAAGRIGKPQLKTGSPEFTRSLTYHPSEVKFLQDLIAYNPDRQLNGFRLLAAENPLIDPQELRQRIILATRRIMVMLSTHEGSFYPTPTYILNATFDLPGDDNSK